MSDQSPHAPLTSGYKAWMQFGTGKAATNALVFATAPEAHAYGHDLSHRWMLPTGYEVRPCDETPTHRWDGETRRAVPLTA